MSNLRQVVSTKLVSAYLTWNESSFTNDFGNTNLKDIIFHAMLPTICINSFLNDSSKTKPNFNNLSLKLGFLNIE